MDNNNGMYKRENRIIKVEGQTTVSGPASEFFGVKDLKAVKQCGPSAFVTNVRTFQGEFPSYVNDIEQIILISNISEEAKKASDICLNNESFMTTFAENLNDNENFNAENILKNFKLTNASSVFLLNGKVIENTIFEQTEPKDYEEVVTRLYHNIGGKKKLPLDEMVKIVEAIYGQKLPPASQLS